MLFDYSSFLDFVVVLFKLLPLIPLRPSPTPESLRLLEHQGNHSLLVP